MWNVNMMCDVMPTISEDGPATGSNAQSHHAAVAAMMHAQQVAVATGAGDGANDDDLQLDASE
jgi:hypothetical protein